MTKEQLIWLYEFIIKQTKEAHLFNPADWEYYTIDQIEREINRLLIKHDCEPLLYEFKTP